jgi:hypothetical protein
VIIGVANVSTLVSGQEVYEMSLLVNRQLRDHVAPAWGLLPPSVLYMPNGAQGQHMDAIITVFDDADQAGDLGYHTEGPDADVYGRVFARPVLANGGNALTADLSVCSVLSHECCETLGDRTCSDWAQAASGQLTAYELCDPVEGDSYRMTITASSGEQVTGTVSDFVLPSWFDSNAAPGPTDYMGLVTAPFQVRPTGYSIVMSGGSVTEQFGERYPLWRLVTKEHPTSRTARRDPSVIPAMNPTSLA